jgi:hypothetical protein
MPDLAADMDMTKKITGIAGMELPMKDSDSDKGMLVSDVFLSVPVVGGDDWNVACLIEQQHDPDKSFTGRIFDSWVRLRASRPVGRTTAFAIYTGNAKNENFYAEECYGWEISAKFRTFHLLSCDVEELKRDKRPFGRVMYAGRLSIGTENDIALREKYAWEILNTTSEDIYNNEQRRFILEFANKIFRLNDPEISRDVREAYKMKTIPLEQYVAEIAKEEGVMEGLERGLEKGKFEVARSMLADGLPAETIRKYTGLEESAILSLR